MTETTAAHTAQHLACTKVGSVGTPLPFCTTKVRVFCHIPPLPGEFSIC